MPLGTITNTQNHVDRENTFSVNKQNAEAARLCKTEAFKIVQRAKDKGVLTPCKTTEVAMANSKMQPMLKQTEDMLNRYNVAKAKADRLLADMDVVLSDLGTKMPESPAVGANLTPVAVAQVRTIRQTQSVLTPNKPPVATAPAPALDFDLNTTTAAFLETDRFAQLSRGMKRRVRKHLKQKQNAVLLAEEPAAAVASTEPVVVVEKEDTPVEESSGMPKWALTATGLGIAVFAGMFLMRH